jgi:ABC-type glutathione transport system ATPase component
MLLEVENLSIGLRGGRRIVEEVSFSLERGACFGLLGESGTGKTLIAYALCGLLSPQMQVLGGSIRFAGETLHPGPPGKLARLRGRRIFMMFQSAAAALNPYMTVGKQIAEALQTKERLSGKAALAEAGALLERVGLRGGLVSAHPFQLSGGMQQRVLIAIALGLHPHVLIADEPTTGLDALSSLRILELLQSLKEEGMAILFISHDLKAIALLADQAGVMRQGRIVESGPPARLLTAPRHPFTCGLAEAARRLEGQPPARQAVCPAK